MNGCKNYFSKLDSAEEISFKYKDGVDDLVTVSSNKDLQDAIDVMKENQKFVRFEVTTISDTITQLSNLGKSETIIHTPSRNRNIKLETQIIILNSPSNEKMKQLLHGFKMIEFPSE